MLAKFALELVKEAQKDCEDKGLADLAKRLQDASRKLLVDADQEEIVRAHER